MDTFQVEDDTHHVYLADFGLGRLLSNTRSLGTATKMAGTPGFQAPEKLRGEEITTGVDVYALGCIFMELFTGMPLYNNMDPHTIMFQVAVKNIFPDFSKLSCPMDRIVGQCLCPAANRISSLQVLKLLLDII